MSASKTKQASKQNAAKQVVQTLDVLPSIKQRPHYPDQLKTASKPFEVVDEEVTFDDGSKQTLPAVWGRINLIQNLPDPKVPGVRRDNPEEWARRMQDYRTIGILQAVGVRPVKSGVYLEYGKHRVMGALELGWTYIRMDVDAKGTGASSAYKGLKENSSRKDDQPLQKARHYKDLLTMGFNQKDVAEIDGTTQSTVSRRLRLVHENMHPELAAHVGLAIDENTLAPLFDVLDDPGLALAGGQALVKALNAKRAPRNGEEALDVMARAWTDQKLAIAVEATCFTHDVRQDPGFRKAMKAFEPFTVKVPDPFRNGSYNRDFYRQAELTVATAQKVSDRLQAEAEEAERRAAEKEARRRAKAGKGGKGDPNAPTVPGRRSIDDRLPERTRRIQLDAMVRHMKAQVSFPDELLVEGLARYIDKCGSLHNKGDQAAALAALGVAAESKQAEAMTSYGVNIERYYADLAPKKPSKHGIELSRDEDGFHALWKKDRTAAMRCVAVAMVFDHNQGASHTLSDDLGAKMLTGLTHEEAEAKARQSLKDQDAGFKPVLDGAPCDHCDEPATLRRKSINVCRSEFYDGITVTTAAARRLARGEAAKAAKAAEEPASKAEPAEGETQAAEPAAAEAAPAEPVNAQPTAEIEAPEAGKPALFKRRAKAERKAAAGA